jgi:bifunctional ADP-heptose synthase (sugar kinase/adenylyltransferase)
MDTQQQKRFKILVIGDSCTDVYHYGECERISPEAPVPILRHIESIKIGGMAKNVYENLTGLGNSVDILTNKENLTKERFIDRRTLQHIMRFDVGESRRLPQLDSSDVHSILFSNYDAVVISDYNKGFLSKEIIRTIVASAKDHNIDVFVDSKKRDLSCFEGCIIKINEFEYSLVTNFPDKYEIIITRGKSGASWMNETFPPVRSEIDSLAVGFNVDLLRSTNVCGAGDTFLSGLVTGYLKTGDLRTSIVFANTCAARAVENFGTYAIKPEDLK